MLSKEHKQKSCNIERQKLITSEYYVNQQNIIKQVKENERNLSSELKKYLVSLN